MRMSADELNTYTRKVFTLIRVNPHNLCFSASHSAYVSSCSSTSEIGALFGLAGVAK